MAITQLRSPLGYCTEQDIENFLLIDINDSFSDQVSNWIVAAEDVVNNFTGYTTASGIFNEAIIEEVSKSGRINNDNDLVVFARKYPIQSVEKLEIIKGTEGLSLTLDNGTRVNYEGNTVPNFRYNLPEPKDRLYYPQREISASGGNLIVGGFAEIRYASFLTRMTYHAGFLEVPGPINLATTMIAADAILRHENKNGLSLLTQGRVTKEWFQRKGGESDLVLDAKDMLRPYIKTVNWLIR